jgi:hypothetical protein
LLNLFSFLLPKVSRVGLQALGMGRVPEASGESV